MDVPAIRYTRTTDGLNIAYQVVGEGPLDLVFVPQVISNVEIFWENPRWAAFMRELASFSRLLLFDRRGVGLSDRPSGVPPLEQRMDDVRAVLDAVGSERAALFGTGPDGAMAVLFAATYPARVPTLVLHRTGDRYVPVDVSRLVAEQVPGALYRELDGIDHIPWVGDAGAVAVAVREFVERIWRERPWEETEPDRVLATVLFTDIVGSTERAMTLGNARWRELLHEHHSRVRGQIARFRGREIDTAGDGFFASFDGPARAIRCAGAVRVAVAELGIEIRAGLHAGECELIDGKVGGVVVHIGARVAAEAEPDEILVSGTVKDLVAGSGIQFEDRGLRTLKGVGEWHLYAVSSRAGAA